MAECCAGNASEGRLGGAGGLGHVLPRFSHDVTWGPSCPKLRWALSQVPECEGPGAPMFARGERD
jgi:hypothetical protein